MEKRKVLPKTLSENLKVLRKKAGLTQQQVTGELKKLGLEITQQSYNRYENNNSSPDYDTLIKLALVLKTDVNTLVGFETNHEDYFNKMTHGDIVATRNGDNTIINFDGTPFALPVQTFKKFVKNANTLATSMTKLDFELYFINSIMISCTIYLSETNYRTAITDVDGVLQLREAMHRALDIVGNHIGERKEEERKKVFGEKIQDGEK